jgi:hypothetical protein
MAADWIMVRMMRSTHSELERVRASMRLGDWQGKILLVRDTRGRVSLDQVIQRLIAFREAHKARVRRSKARRRSTTYSSASSPANDAGSSLEGSAVLPCARS